MTKVTREWLRMPRGGIFGRMARRGGWKAGWVYWADGVSRDGYQVTGMGPTARAALNDLTLQRVPPINSSAYVRKSEK